MADERIIQCTDKELAAYVREQRANAVDEFVNDSAARVRSSTGYYSTVRFQLVCGALAGGKYPLSIDQVEGGRQAFAYSLGQSMTIAGFVTPASTQNYATASKTQTNMSQPKATRSGERFIITGISAVVTAGSDMLLARWVWQHAFVDLVKNDTDRQPLGPLSFFPAQSSLNGQGDSLNQRPALSEIKYTTTSMRSSESMFGKFDLSASPLIWMPVGDVDGSMFLSVGLDEPYAASVEPRAAALPDYEAWSPLAAENSAPIGPNATPGPVRFGTFVDILFKFEGTSERIMSRNQ